jgi:hypothetical protein
MRATTDVVRFGENFLYVFKGARSAPGPGWPPHIQERRATAALTVERRGSSTRSWLVTWGPGMRWAPAAFLWPSGPRRRRRGLEPRSRPHRQCAVTSAVARGCKRSHPSSARILKPRVLPVKSTRCARVAARSLRASGPLRRRDQGAPIGGMARTERSHIQRRLRVSIDSRSPT